MSANRKLAAYSGVHFMVDLACIFLMTAFVRPLMGSSEDWLWCVVLYNMFAFAFQLPIGALGDIYGKPGRMAAFGCFLVALAYIVIGAAQAIGGLGLNVAIIVGAVVAGIGNGFFHVCGGISTIHESKGRASRAGIFVSTGAMGVFLAWKLGDIVSNPFVGLICGFVLMAISGYILLKVCSSDTTLASSESRATGSGYIAIALLLLTVCIRSYTGGLFTYSWKSAPLMGFLFTLGIVMGKMAGGIIGDRVGWEKSSVVSLLLSLVLFHFAPSSPVLGIAGVLLFNMTMPITLMAIVNILGVSNAGTAFGLTTLALFVGTLPSTLESFFGLDLTPMEMIAPTIVISAAAIFVGVYISQRGSLPSESGLGELNKEVSS